jgi:hypothetical protein
MCAPNNAVAVVVVVDAVDAVEVDAVAVVAAAVGDAEEEGADAVEAVEVDAVARKPQPVVKTTNKHEKLLSIYD